MRPYILAESNWYTIASDAPEVLVLPWGATEAHNYHLPYGTDNYQVDYVASESARRAREAGASVMVLPTVPYGVNTGQIDIPLCVNLHPSTQARMLSDILQSMDRQGFRKLLLLNGHGGNDFKMMVREIGADYPGIAVLVCNWYEIIPRLEMFEHDGDHADEMETSVMLFIRGDLVAPIEQAGDGSTRPFVIDALNEGWAWKERDWRQVSDDTGSGDPSKADAGKGGRYLEAVTTRLAGLLTQFESADPDRLYRKK